MVNTGRVSEILGQNAAHHLDDGRVDGCSCVMVEIDAHPGFFIITFTLTPSNIRTSVGLDSAERVSYTANLLPSHSATKHPASIFSDWWRVNTCGNAMMR